MRKDEANLWQRIATNMPRTTYPALRLERIEAMMNDGIPDVHALARGRTSWIELKAVKGLPSREFGIVLSADHQKLNQDQKNWHLDYRRCGGHVATLIGIGSYDYALIDGAYSDTINEMSWPLMQRVAAVIGSRETFFPAFYDWLERKI